MTKKIFIAAIFTTLLFLQGWAQDSRKFNIGFQFTPELTWLKPKSQILEGRGSNIGFSFGPVFDYNFGDNYAFSTGITINRSNGGLTYKDTTRFNTQSDILYDKGSIVEYKLQYVEIPLAIKLKTNEIGYMTYFGCFGIVPAVNISAKGTFENSSTPNNKFTPESIKKDVTLPNVSMLISAGAEYGLSTNTSAFVSVNFYNGLIDVTRNPKGFKSKAIMNRVGLTVGILF